MVEVNFTLFMVMLIATWICGAITAYAIYTVIENHETIERTLDK